MRIHNVRFGRATNSSSSHSLIVLRPGESLHDSDVERQEFGWNFFTAASREAKMTYLAQMISSTVQGKWGNHAASIVAGEIAGVKCDKDGYVDHQSVMGLPWTRDGKDLNLDFLRDFKEFLQRDDVAVLGGNDNTDESHSDKHTMQSELDLPFLNRGGTSIFARKDGEHWVLFNAATGDKVRMTFGNQPYVKASRPELVDVKITDFCNYGCAYCYQASTPKGKPADRRVLSNLAHALGKMEVFEVAIGGGEPTTHEHLADFVRSLDYNGISTSLTTRNLDVFQYDPAQVPLKAIGFSVDDAVRAREVIAAFRAGRYKDRQLTLQYVVGVQDDSVLKKIMQAVKKQNYSLKYAERERAARLLLLGYKRVGRGTEPKFPGQVNTWRALAKGVGLYSISIDTALARECESQLEKDRLFFTTKEGDFTMYVDAVTGKVGRSSYDELEEVPDMLNTEWSYRYSTMADDLTRHFQKWT